MRPNKKKEFLILLVYKGKGNAREIGSEETEKGDRKSELIREHNENKKPKVRALNQAEVGKEKTKGKSTTTGPWLHKKITTKTKYNKWTATKNLPLFGYNLPKKKKRQIDRYRQVMVIGNN